MSNGHLRMHRWGIEGHGQRDIDGLEGWMYSCKPRRRRSPIRWIVAGPFGGMAWLIANLQYKFARHMRMRVRVISNFFISRARGTLAIGRADSRNARRWCAPIRRGTRHWNRQQLISPI